ncbi:MAG: 1-(5-phosphoribosyl)-5-[(5-phosphoribosylamino)methylideneamino]imidazole-4-carboxamide isomerase [Candidatus Firestonebacteria bacterium]|nr:1-(5-phosphoribosyl)-5-[(5-phosphoribosylamino)methylideneamino]imidazole-4-carboxamide isomerase [Candidatus Firestonebacteria bacterium]
MEILPAIDIRGGNCVRLDQGRLERETIFSHEPVSMAKIWEQKGATCLHVVDLDGAFEGFPCNLEIVKKIVNSVNIPIQLGGGIRTLDAIDKILNYGINRVVLGTSAYKNLDIVKKAVSKYQSRIVVGVDASDGKIAINGWKEVTDLNAEEFIIKLQNVKLCTIIYTDISRDGMLKGPNIKAIKKIAKKTKISVIASGGISSLEDIKNIKELEKYGVAGVIIGKALYTGAFELEEALEIMKE